MALFMTKFKKSRKGGQNRDYTEPEDSVPRSQIERNASSPLLNFHAVAFLIYLRYPSYN